MDVGQITDFIHYLRFEKRYSSHTISAYQSDLAQFAAFFRETFQLEDISAADHFHVRSWLAGMKEEKNAARTINRKLSSLNSFFKFQMKRGLATSNPVRLLHAQRLPERIPSALKQADTDYLLQEATFEPGFKGTTDRLICELLYTTGMRRNELLQLKEKDVEWSLKQLRILGKGNKERLVPVSAAMLDTVKDYLQEKEKLEICNHEYLLTLDNGLPLYAGYVYRTVNKYLSQATTLKKKSPHVLRHTFATHLLNNGANIQAIRDLLGHSSLAATQIYTQRNS